MTRSLRHARDLARRGATLSDRPPGRSATVPAERDPLTGRWLRGDPSGRADKGRSGDSRPPGTAALAVAGAILVAAAIVLAVLLAGGGDDGDQAAAPQQPAASQQVPEPAPEPVATPEPAPQFTGPRTVPVSLTTTSYTPPPGFGPDPSLGTVGEVRPRTWVLTGPCDGAGACTVEHCLAPAECRPPLAATPTGAGEYTATSTGPVIWANPSCSGGSITATITFRVAGPPEAPSVLGTWVESADPVLVPGPAPCGIYLGTFSITSP